MEEPINILIVDDESRNLTVLESILDDPGYRLVRAESADQALLALVVEEFALLMLDIRMPGMTGFELAKMIKERKKTALVPIIFLTAYYNDDEHVFEGYDRGAVDYLHKPVNPAILRAKVAIFAELYRKNRRADHELATQQTQLKGIIASAMDAIITVNEHERVVVFNHAAESMFLCQHADAIGQPLARFIPERFRQEYRAHIHAFTSTQPTSRSKGPSGAWFALRANGEEFPIEASVSHAQVDGTSLLTLILRDVTERKRQEEELRRLTDNLEVRVGERTAELMQSQIRLRALAMELNRAEQRERKRLAGELHDYLAQMLVVVRLNIGQARRLALPPNVDELLKDTEEVLNKALMYSRTLIAELSPPVLQEHGLPSALTWLGTQMQRHDLAVTVDLGGTTRLSLPEESALLLFQSVRELLMNALKHAKCKAVMVRVYTVDSKLHIQVRDDGIGFDVMAKNITSSASTLSSNLGLFSIEERMRDLGGWFDLQSTPGQGTSATLILELEKPTAASDGLLHPSPAPRVLPQPRVPSNSTSIRILLVDDHAMVRQGLRTMLESYPGMEVVGEACNGEEAVQAAEVLQPSLIVMDVNMPRMNGIQATATIKARFHDIIIIGLSVQAGGANAEAMSRAGAAMLITKEAAVDELHDRIQTVIAEAQQGGQGSL
ncbi:MAG: response regulator [Nitrospirales bacterium]